MSIRCLRVAAVALSPILLGCGARATDTEQELGRRGEITTARVHIVFNAAGATVTGDAGAVAVPGATVIVTDATSGEVHSTHADAQGGFSVTLVGGTAGDEYLVQVGAATTLVAFTSDASNVACLEESTDEPPEGETLGLTTCATYHAEAVCRARRYLREADTTCDRDEDCELIDRHPECNAACEVAAALNHAGAQAYRSDMTAINQQICAPFAAEGCALFAPQCAPIAEGSAICLRRTCTWASKELLAAAQAELTCSHTVDSMLSNYLGPHCSELATEANCRLDEQAKQLTAPCSVDSDCTLVEAQEGSCHSGCSNLYSIRQTTTAAFADVRRDVDDQVCGLGRELGCDVIPAFCGGLSLRAACVQGTCDYSL